MARQSRMKPMSPQARHKDQDSNLATKFSCGECRISYYATSARCPLCDAYRQLEDMRRALQEVSRRFEATSNLAEKLQSQVDAAVAITKAIELLDDNDKMFLKTVLYQWKLDRSVTLKLTHAGSLDLGVTSRARQRNLRPNGFMSIVRGAEPVAHTCTSMGGLAIAEYYEEALHTVGSAAAMNLLLRGFAKLLPGATG